MGPAFAPSVIPLGTSSTRLGILNMTSYRMTETIASTSPVSQLRACASIWNAPQIAESPCCAFRASPAETNMPQDSFLHVSGNAIPRSFSSYCKVLEVDNPPIRSPLACAFFALISMTPQPPAVALYDSCPKSSGLIALCKNLVLYAITP